MEASNKIWMPAVRTKLLPRSEKSCDLLWSLYKFYNMFEIDTKLRGVLLFSRNPNIPAKPKGVSAGSNRKDRSASARGEVSLFGKKALLLTFAGILYFCLHCLFFACLFC